MPAGEDRPALGWKFVLGAAAVAAPLAAFMLAVLLTHGNAQKGYFEAVSQILPVLLLALAIEQGYFSRRHSAPDMEVRVGFRDRHVTVPLARLYVLQARVYALTVLVILGLGEWVSVEVLATGISDENNLKFTAGSLATGFTALIVSALVGTKQTAN